MKQTWQKYKDPKGGLTAKAVAVYRKQNPGSKLKTGVKGKADTPEKLRRKGGYLTRFFGRSPLPPLKKPNGEPTRLALSARAWSEPVPTTTESAKRLYSKGKAMLERYKRSKQK